MNSAVFREVFLAGGLVSLLLGAMFLSTGTFPPMAVSYTHLTLPTIALV